MEIVELIKVLWLRKWIVLLVFGAVCAGAVLCALVMPTTYESEAQMLIQGSESASSVLSSIGLGDARQTQETTDDMDNEVALATTEPVLQEVIDKLQLKDRHGKPLTVKKFTTWIIAYHALFPRPNVEIEQVENATILTITSRARDAKQAKAIADTLAEVYGRVSVQRRAEDFKRARAYVNQRLDDLRQKYMQAIQESRQLRPPTTIPASNEVVVTTAAMTDNSQVESLKRSLTTLEQQLQTALTEKTESHPDVQSLRQQIVLTRDLLRQELAIYQDTAEADFKVANAKSVYAAMQLLAGRLDVAEAMVLDNVRVVQPGTVPDLEKPASPNKLLIAILAILLGGMAAVLAAFVAQYLDDSIRTPEALEKAGIPCLGVIPQTRAHGRLFTDPDTKELAAYEAYRALRNRVRAAGNPASILIASTGPGEGRTTLAINLAASLAREGKRTVLVDADLRHPRIQKRLGLSGDRGLDAVLRDRVPPASALQPSRLAGLSVVASSRPADDAAALIDSAGLPAALTALKSAADVMVLDSPPLSEGEDALVVSGSAAAVLLVVEEGATPTSELLAAARMFAAAGRTVCGAVINKHVNRWSFEWLRSILIWT